MNDTDLNVQGKVRPQFPSHCIPADHFKPVRRDGFKTGTSLGSLRDAIYEYVRENAPVFPELQRHFARFVEVEGCESLELIPNGILWNGLSDVLADTIQSLLREQRIFLAPASQFDHMQCGVGLDLPLFDEAEFRDESFARPVWIPVFLTTDSLIGPTSDSLDSENTEIWTKAQGVRHGEY